MDTKPTRDAKSGRKPTTTGKSDINMDAYNAYYNNEAGRKPGTAAGDRRREGDKGAKIITNIMHINHSGANINI